MQFGIWGMQWIPKGRGLPPPPKERSPGVHSQQNSLGTSAPLTIPNKRLARRAWAFAEAFGILLTELTLLLALRSL